MTAKDPKTVIRRIFNKEFLHNRFFILFLSCLVLFSGYYCQDIPSMMKAEFTQLVEKKAPGSSEYYFDLMYSLYSFPNIVLPFISGIMIDKIGYRSLILLFSGLVAFGNIIVYLGVGMESPMTMLLGRFVYGLGGESLGLAVNTLQILWFKGKELGLSQALALSAGRIGSVMNCFLTPKLAHNGMGSAYGMAVGICILSFFAALIMIGLDSSAPRSAVAEVNSSGEPQPQASFKAILKDLKQCRLIFWVHIGAMTFFYLAYLPLNMVASGYLLETWANDSSISVDTRMESIGNILSIPLLMSSACFPLFGYFADNFGQRINFMYLSAVALIGGYFGLLFLPPIMALIMIGFGYSIFGTVLWPVLVFLVPERIVGTALGFVNAVQNFAMTLFPIFLAFLASSSGNNTPGVITLLTCATLSIASVMIMNRLDKLNPVSLNSKDQKALVEAVEELYTPKSSVPLADRAISEDDEINNML